MNQGMDVSITRLEAGPFLTNTYLVSSGGEAILIDPGVGAATILDGLPLQGMHVLYVASTHGHLDHVFDTADLKEKLGSDFAMGNGDEEILSWSYSVSEKYMGRPLQHVEVERHLEDGDAIEFGGASAGVVSLPGHTPGSIGFLVGDVFFTGDTLFKGTIGRTDLGGSMPAMENTLRKILSMDGNLRVLPGHGPETVLSHEFASNPFLIPLREED